MSYAYNITGVGEKADTRSEKNKIEYSRNEFPHYDYNIGTEPGQLLFVQGQMGSKPNFYTDGRGMDDATDEAPLENFDDMVRALPPSAFDAFAEEFDVTERPDFPELDASVREYEVTGASLAAELAEHDRAGSALTLVRVQAPEHGTFTTNGPASFTRPIRDTRGRTPSQCARKARNSPPSRSP